MTAYAIAVIGVLIRAADLVLEGWEGHSVIAPGELPCGVIEGAMCTGAALTKAATAIALKTEMDAGQLLASARERLHTLLGDTNICNSSSKEEASGMLHEAARRAAL